jgi:DNA (cytosine-5)-methyltransferase 1
LENVKGLLSNDNGKTFGTILEELGNIGYWCEWQTLNSKHFGVPQNRERVFIVGHLRETSTRQVFPIRKVGQVSSEEANSEPESWEASTLEASYGKNKSLSNMIDTAGAITGGGHSGGLHSQMTLIYDGHHHQLTKKMGTLTGRENRQGTNWLVVADRTRSYAKLGRNLESPKDVANALSGVQKDNLVLAVETAHTKANMKQGRFSKECHALDGGKSKAVMIANAVDCDGYLRSGTRPRDENGKPQLLPIGYRRIRRLTPTECERLQSFPDAWTEGVSDTQRYKLLGNAVTTNVIEFLGQRLSSLFCC